MNLHRTTLNLLSAGAIAALLVGTTGKAMAEDKDSTTGGGKKLLIYILAGQSDRKSVV